MNADNDEIEDNIGTQENLNIVSFVWCDGHISATMFNTTTFELKVTFETIDLRPEFWHLKNLFRQLQIRVVLASGPPIFLTTIMQLLGMDDKIDPNTYRLQRLQSLSAASFIVYTNNEKTLITNRQRILELHLPNMASDISDQHRFHYIETLLPLHQTLVVQSLGNLLNYLDANWKYLFLMQNSHVIINDVVVHKLDDDVCIDEATFSAMQIFTVNDHPSAFKKSATSENMKQNGLSIFGLINANCVSRLGSNQLKTWLYQPTRNIDELKYRYCMIAWCRNERNAVNKTKFRAALKRIHDASELYAKLIRTRGKPTLWRSFKQSLYFTNSIGEICVALIKSNATDIDGTLIQEFGHFAEANNQVHELLVHLNLIIDFDESLKSGKFAVRSGLDSVLDEKKDKFRAITDEMQTKVRIELENQHLSECFHNIQVMYLQEMGFLLCKTLFSFSHFIFIFKAIVIINN